MSRPLPRVCIVGGGPGGMAAGIWAARLGLEPVIVEAGTRLGGQLLTLTNEITDYPGFPSIDGPGLAAKFEEHVRTMGVEVLLGQSVNSLVPPRIQTSAGTELRADAAILATGVRRRTLGIEREEDFKGRGVSYSVTRDAHRVAGGVGVVVGGGDAAVEGALILSDMCREVVLVHRAQLRARPDFVTSVRSRTNIHVLAGREVVGLLGEASLEAVVLDDDTRLETRALFIRVGVEPRLGALAVGLPVDAGGYLEVDRQYRCKGDIYAVGDICSPRTMSISAAVGQAMIACKHIQLTARRAGV